MLIQPYFRRSKADKKRRLSVELQREEFALWLEKHPDMIALPAREDDGKSAFTENPAKRPAFFEMMKDARNRKFDAIWVYMYDRFARKLALAAPCFEELDRLGIRVMSATESEDWETQMQTSLEAEKFARKLSTRIKSSKQFDARRGIWVGAVPYGYDRVDGKLAPNADAPIVTLIFELFATNGYAMMNVVDELRARGITRTSPCHKDGEPYAFGAEGIRQIVSNRAYIGEVRCNEIVVPNAHAALVDMDTWQAAQEIRARRATHRGRLTIQSPDRGILTGVVRCAICGAPMWHNNNGRGYRSYGCSQRLHYHACENRLADVTDVDRYALHLLSRLRLPQDWQARALSIVAAEQRQRPAPDAVQIERELRRARELFLEGQIGVDEYRTRETALKAAHAPAPPVVPVNLNKTAAHLADMAALVAHTTVDEQRALVSTIFDRVWLRSSVIEAWTPRSAYLPLFATLYNEPPDVESSGGKYSPTPFPFFPHLWIDHKQPLTIGGSL